ncbi:MAG: ATP-binding protein [Lachnospiraceae bacterium]|nr:ATP-binding protein [Lachnospiraceae bacterium]
MLLRYIVSNFKSIGHPVEFSMFPAEKNTDERFLKTITTKAGEWKVLHRGGFFGPNASGKTSFIESVDFARGYIVNGQKSGKGTGIEQFRGEIEELKGISSFQFMFYIEEEVYEYGFSLDRRQVYEEWLMQLTEKEFVPLFSRVTDEEGKTEIEIESRFAEKSPRNGRWRRC